MLVSSIPPKFPVPFGNAAGGAYIRSIPTASQIGVVNGAASLTDGFPPLTFLSVNAGGVPPFGQDFNGLLKQITQWLQWAQAGGPIFFDVAFAASIGGYPKGALLSSAATVGLYWISTIDNNSNDFDTGNTTGWSSFNALATPVNTGDCKWRPTIEIITGWVRCNFLT